MLKFIGRAKGITCRIHYKESTVGTAEWSREKKNQGLALQNVHAARLRCLPCITVHVRVSLDGMCGLVFAGRASPSAAATDPFCSTNGPAAPP